jgi:hypothetical protein
MVIDCELSRDTHIHAYTHALALVVTFTQFEATSMTTAAADPSSDRLLVQIASYNTALQGLRGVPQDLVDWLSPTLKVSKFLSRQPRAPDIVAVGFQELLPLHQGRMYRTALLLFDPSRLNVDD